MGKNIRRITKQKQNNKILKRINNKNGEVVYLNNNNILTEQEISKFKEEYFQKNYINKNEMNSFKSEKETKYLKKKYNVLSSSDGDKKIEGVLRIKEVEYLNEYDTKKVIKIKKVAEEYQKYEKKIDEISKEYNKLTLNNSECSNVVEDLKTKYEKVYIEDFKVKIEGKENRIYYYVRRLYTDEFDLLKSRIEFMNLFEDLLQKSFTTKVIDERSISFDDINIIKFFGIENRKDKINESCQKITNYDLTKLYSTEYYKNKSVEEKIFALSKILKINTKIDKNFYTKLLEKIIKQKFNNKEISYEYLYDILKSDELKDLLYKQITLHDRGEVEKFIDSSLGLSVLNKKGENKKDKRDKLKDNVYNEYKNKYKCFKIKMNNILNTYEYDKLIKEIKKKKPKDFIELKTLISEHYKNVFVSKEGEEFSYKVKLNDNQIVLTKMTHDFIKGRYKKAKKNKIESYKKIEILFNENLKEKIISRVYSRLQSRYINDNKFNLFLEDNMSKYKSSSVFKEIVKAEDTIRRKLATYVMDINLMYYANNNKKDALGASTYEKSLKLIENKEPKKSNITLDLDEAVYDKLYSAFELRNHVYHYQEMIKHQKNKKEWKNFQKSYENLNDTAKELNSKLKTSLKIKLTSNNIWLLENSEQEKIIEFRAKKNKVKNQYLPRFNKIYTSIFSYKRDVYSEGKTVEDYLVCGVYKKKMNELKENQKSILKQIFRYYYQTYYEYEFVDYVNKEFNLLKSKIKCILCNNKINKTDKSGTKVEENNPKIEEFNKILVGTNNLIELNENIQAHSKGNQKQLKNFLKLYNEVLGHVYLDYIKKKEEKININYAIEYFTKSNSGEKLNKDEKIKVLNEKIEQYTIELIKTEDIKNIKSDYFLFNLFSISEFLDIRNLNHLNNDLKKYRQFLVSLDENYKDFKNLWESIILKLLGKNNLIEGESHIINFNEYINKLEKLIYIQEIMIFNVDADRQEKLDKEIDKKVEENITSFYNGMKKEVIKIRYYKTSDIKTDKDNGEVYFNLIKFEHKEDNESAIDKVIPLDIFLREEEKGIVKFLKNKHNQFLKENFSNTYEDIFKFYEGFRGKSEDEKNCIDRLKEIPEIENEKFKKIKENFEVASKSNRHLEFIQYIQKEYEEKYKKLSELQIDKKSNKKNSFKAFKLNINFKETEEYTTLKSLKILINNYDFIKKMINLKVIKNSEEIINNIQGRISDFYRTTERDSVYLEKQEIENFKFTKTKILFYDLKEKYVCDVQNSNKKNKDCFEFINTSRNNTVHKNFLQKYKKEEDSILNQYSRANEGLNYDIKLKKSIFEVFEKNLKKKNLLIEFNYGNYKNPIKNIEIASIERLDLYNKEDKKVNSIPLMSEYEMEYIKNIIGIDVKNLKKNQKVIFKKSNEKDGNDTYKSFGSSVTTGNSFSEFFDTSK